MTINADFEGQIVIGDVVVLRVIVGPVDEVVREEGWVRSKPPRVLWSQKFVGGPMRALRCCGGSSFVAMINWIMRFRRSGCNVRQ